MWRLQDFNCRVGTLPSMTNNYCYFRQSVDTRHVPTPLDRHFASSFNACRLLLLNGLFGHTAQFTNISIRHPCQSGVASSIVDYIAVSHSILKWVDQRRGVVVEHIPALSPGHALLTVLTVLIHQPTSQHSQPTVTRQPEATTANCHLFATSASCRVSSHQS